MALALLIVLEAAVPGAAHSLHELESRLSEREKYFQPVETEAPGFTLEDAEGEPVRLADLRGKVVVLHFIYASCPDVCPLHAERIAEVQDMINRTPMKDEVRFLSITTDPQKDTPSVLRDYGPAHGLDGANWAFLRPAPGQPEDSTRNLAQAYGHTFLKGEDGYQTHGVVTHVIDRNGIWRANFHGLQFKPANLVLFVNGLVNEADQHDHTPGWWQRVRDLF